MPLPPMRPTFDLEVPLGPDRSIESLRTLRQSHKDTLVVKNAGHHLMLSVVGDQRHLWSPWLSLEIKPHDPGALVHGRFSPAPALWTGIMLTWIAISTLVFFALVIALSQHLSESAPTALWALIPLTLIAAALYTSSQIGQRLAQDQMRLLYDTTTRTLGLDIPASTDP